ncbi:MAG: hypothetical protein M1834_007041 [Cirrosporium novae-zelandiae]|nr:MAG: hypothetical protein M1834_007041 [Cirrosporium novae-zelandiae]
MHTSTLLSALLSVGALASPLKRFAPFMEVHEDVVTDLDIVTVTVYVTATAPEVVVSETASTTTIIVQGLSSSSIGDFENYWWHQPQQSHPSATPSSVTEVSSVATPSANTQVVVVSTVAESTSEAAATYVAPVTTAAVQTITVAASTSTAAAVTSTAESSSESVVISETPDVAVNVAATSTSSSAIPSGTIDGGDDYESRALYHHNVHRANHTDSDLTWNSTLASIAATIASSCVYEHDTTTGGGGYGQNIAGGVATVNIGQAISNLFYNSEVGYYTDLYGEDSPDMTNFESWGHFSQIVWDTTETVGCATQYCSGGLKDSDGNDMGVEPYFTVCNYYPAGNWAGEYTAVHSSLGRPTVSSPDLSS